MLAALPFEAELRQRWGAHALHWALAAKSPHLAARSHQVPPPCCCVRHIRERSSCSALCITTLAQFHRFPLPVSPLRICVVCELCMTLPQVYRALRPALGQEACARLLERLEASLRQPRPPLPDLQAAVDVIITLGVRLPCSPQLGLPHLVNFGFDVHSMHLSCGENVSSSPVLRVATLLGKLPLNSLEKRPHQKW